MTTIACNTRVMAADSLVCEEGLAGEAYHSEKITRVGTSVFGEAGTVDETPLVYEWIRNGAALLDRPVMSSSADFLLLELAPDGVFIWTHHLTRTRINEGVAAIGSGGPIALYCMKVRKMSPQEAVAEAAKIDRWTGLPISFARAGDEPELWKKRRAA